MGDVTLDGGDSGIVIDGNELLRGLTGLERRGLGNVALEVSRGVGGGDGVDEAERKVGPGFVDSGDTS